MSFNTNFYEIPARFLSRAIKDGTLKDILAQHEIDIDREFQLSVNEYPMGYEPMYRFIQEPYAQPWPRSRFTIKTDPSITHLSPIKYKELPVINKNIIDLLVKAGSFDQNLQYLSSEPSVEQANSYLNKFKINPDWEAISQQVKKLEEKALSIGPPPKVEPPPPKVEPLKFFTDELINDLK